MVERPSPVAWMTVGMRANRRAGSVAVRGFKAVVCMQQLSCLSSA
jgi:hypothetical protein